MKAIIRAFGRYCEMRRGVLPDSVNATMVLISRLTAASTAARATAEAKVPRPVMNSTSLSRVSLPSTSAQIRDMVWTARVGKSPTAVSALSITASVRASTALATSVTSARVGRDALVIDSSISVAVMEMRPAALARRSMSAWTSGIRSSGI